MQNIDEQNIIAALKDKTPAQAVEFLTLALERCPESASLLIERGRMHWRMGNRGAAMSDYAAADRLQPNGTAAILLAHSQGIMDFFNPDLLNP